MGFLTYSKENQIRNHKNKTQVLNIQQNISFEDKFPISTELGINLDVIDLLKKMLEFNPINRITAKEALLHPLFDNIRKNYNIILDNPNLEFINKSIQLPNTINEIKNEILNLH